MKKIERKSKRFKTKKLQNHEIFVMRMTKSPFRRTTKLNTKFTICGNFSFSSSPGR